MNTRKVQRIRTKLRALNPHKYRLSLYRSNLHLFAQIIDDTRSLTLVSADTKSLKEKFKSKIDSAKKIGEIIAAKAKQTKISVVYFDRSGFRFHGRVKAFCESAREGGLKF